MRVENVVIVRVYAVVPLQLLRFRNSYAELGTPSTERHASSSLYAGMCRDYKEEIQIFFK